MTLDLVSPAGLDDHCVLDYAAKESLESPAAGANSRSQTLNTLAHSDMDAQLASATPGASMVRSGGPCTWAWDGSPMCQLQWPN